MSQMGRAVLAMLAALAATGCITSTTLVKVKADGSGTIEQTVSMKEAAAADLKAMMAGFGSPEPAEEKPKDAPLEIFSEKDMREAAPRLGEGVSFVSSTAIKADGRVGRTAVYAFSDVTRLRVDQKPPTPGPSDAVKASSVPEVIRFAFARLPNGHSQLSILFPDSAVGDRKTDSAKTPAAAKKPDPAQLEMMKKMFDGLKIDMAVEVGGPIVKTNSEYVQGRRVTLLEMDFSQLLQDQQQLEQIAAPKSIEDAKQALKNIKGFKVNLDRQVTVEFADR